MLDYQKIGSRILQLRKKAKLTQVELSEMLGISHQAVSKWENGESLPDIELVLRLSRIFNLSMEQLLLGHNEELSIAQNVPSNPIVTESSEGLWNEVLKEIKKQINEHSYNTWFKLTTARLDNDTLIISCPNPFSTEWLLNKYSLLIAQTLEAITGNITMKLTFQTAVPAHSFPAGKASRAHLAE